MHTIQVPKGVGANWHFDQIEVLNLGSGAKVGGVCVCEGCVPTACDLHACVSFRSLPILSCSSLAQTAICVCSSLPTICVSTVTPLLQAVFVYNDWLEGGEENDPKSSVTLLEASSAEARAQRKTVSGRKRKEASNSLLVV